MNDLEKRLRERVGLSMAKESVYVGDVVALLDERDDTIADLVRALEPFAELSKIAGKFGLPKTSGSIHRWEDLEGEYSLRVEHLLNAARQLKKLEGR